MIASHSRAAPSWRQCSGKTRRALLSRRGIWALHSKQVSDTTSEVATIFQAFFADQAEYAARKIEEMEPRAVPKSSGDVSFRAESLSRLLFSGPDWTGELQSRVSMPMAQAIERATVESVALHEISGNRRTAKAAENVMAQLIFGSQWDYPLWLQTVILGSLRRQLMQPYWERVATVTTLRDLARVLEMAVRLGLSFRDTARQIRDNLGPQYQQVRAERIARTEIAEATNAGAMAGISHVAQELGGMAENAKEWVAAFVNTRPTHADADGQVVHYQADFVVGGHPAPYPAHSSLPPEERINCMCTVLSGFLVNDANASEKSLHAPSSKHLAGTENDHDQSSHGRPQGEGDEPSDPLNKPFAIAGKFKSGGVVFDAERGIGATDMNADVNYFGYAVEMKPSAFLGLNTIRPNQTSVDFFAQAVLDGTPLGPLTIYTEYDKEKGEMVVTGHEGRGRAMGIIQAVHDQPLFVHVFARRADGGELRPNHWAGGDAALTREQVLMEITPDPQRDGGRPFTPRVAILANELMTGPKSAKHLAGTENDHDQSSHGRPGTGGHDDREEPVDSSISEDEELFRDLTREQQEALHDAYVNTSFRPDDPIIVAGVEIERSEAEHNLPIEQAIIHQAEKHGLGLDGPLAPGEPIGLWGEYGNYEPEAEPDIDEFMRNQFHTTDYWTPGSGFVLYDGAKLELGHRSGFRDNDHRIILPSEAAARRWGWPEDTIDNRTVRLHETMKRARAIRVDVGHELSIDMAHSPTSAQRRTISEYMNDNDVTAVWDVELPDGSRASGTAHTAGRLWFEVDDVFLKAMAAMTKMRLSCLTPHSKHLAGTSHDHDQSDHGRQGQSQPSTSTAVFRRWFGRSKVINKQGDPARTARSEVNQGADEGEPLVVFHGTNADFRVFDNPHDGWNMFSESREYAQTFAINFGPSDRGQVMELYLRVENPLDLTHIPARRGDARRKLLDTLEDVIPEEFFSQLKTQLAYERDIYQIVNSRRSRRLLMQALRAGQFDGIRMPDHRVHIEDGQRREVEAITWIAFDPEQIKSVDNEGSFDPDNPDIFKHGPGGQAHDQLSHGRVGHEP